MESYNIFTSPLTPGVFAVRRDGDHASIPMDTGNKCCVQFIADWKAGAVVLHVDGSRAMYSDTAATALGLKL